MKKKIFILSIIMLFIVASSYRFIQLNKPILGESKNIEVKNDSSFNINGVEFKLDKIEILKNVNESDTSTLKVSLLLNKDGDITTNGFRKCFPDFYPDLISLNISNNDGILVENYTSERETYNEDNHKFLEIQSGKRSISEKKESLILKFNLDNKKIEEIRKNNYNVKLVFPRDDNYIKVNFITIDL